MKYELIAEWLKIRVYSLRHRVWLRQRARWRARREELYISLHVFWNRKFRATISESALLWSEFNSMFRAKVNPSFIDEWGRWSSLGGCSKLTRRKYVDHDGSWEERQPNHFDGLFCDSDIVVRLIHVPTVCDLHTERAAVPKNWRSRISVQWLALQTYKGNESIITSILSTPNNVCTYCLTSCKRHFGLSSTAFRSLFSIRSRWSGRYISTTFGRKKVWIMRLPDRHRSE